MTTHDIPKVREKQARVDRWDTVERSAKLGGIVATLAIVIVLLAQNLVLSGRLQSVQHVQKDIAAQGVQTACSNRLTADVLAAAGRALAAPPAPNGPRDTAVTDIIKTADRLSRSDAVCAHGVPGPFKPTTPATTVPPR